MLPCVPLQKVWGLQQGLQSRGAGLYPTCLRAKARVGFVRACSLCPMSACTVACCPLGLCCSRTSDEHPKAQSHSAMLCGLGTQGSHVQRFGRVKAMEAEHVSDFLGFPENYSRGAPWSLQMCPALSCVVGEGAAVLRPWPQSCGHAPMLQMCPLRCRGLGGRAWPASMPSCALH